MTKTTRFQRLLAMLVSIAVLASCLAVAGIHVSAATTVWDFESEAIDGTNLSLYKSDSMKVTDEKNHTIGGGKSLKLETAQTAGGERAQTFIKDGSGNIVTVAQGEILTVSIWVYVPSQANYTNNALRLWLTATQSDAAYTSGGQKDAEKIYENAGTSGVEHNIPADTWHQITVETNGAHAGKLRMGLCASNQGKKITFYADDITVVRDGPDPTPTVTGTAYNYKFDVNNGLYWGDAGKTGPYYAASPIATSYNQGYTPNQTETKPVANGSGYAMQMAYTGNEAEVNTEVQIFSAFTLPNTYDVAKNGRNPGQTIHLEVGSAFKVTVKGKVANYVSSAKLYAAAYKGEFCGLGENKKNFATHYANRTELGQITAAGDFTFSGVLVPTNKDALTILLKMDDDTNRKGTKVLITEVDIQPTTVATIKFNTDGGNPIDDIYGNVGDAVVLPADPTRNGYIFQGWYREDGKDLPAKFENGDITLKALWLPVDAAVMDAEDLSVDYTLQINTTGTDLATVSDDYNRTKNGAKSIKVESKQTSRERSQFFVRDGGNVVTLEKGKDYQLSFWYYVPSTAADSGIKYWFAAGSSTTAYSNADDAGFFGERIACSDKTIDAAVKGKWTQVVVDFNDSNREGNLRFGVCGTSSNYTLYIDDVTVYEVKPFVSDPNTMDFENVAEGQDYNISAILNQAIKVSGDFNHTEKGSKSVKFTPKDQGGGTRPQLMVKDGNGAQVMVEEGKTYEFTCWLYLPETEGNYSVSYWWAACDSETAFADGAAKDAAKIYEALFSTETAGAKGTWTKLSITMKSPKTGKLRFGACGSDSNAKTRIFYVDDITVKEVIPYIQDPEVESFESYPAGEKLSINTSTSSVTVSSDRNATPNGSQAALVTSYTKMGGNRAQFMIKDGKGDQVMIKKGDSYKVSFKYFVPDDQPNVHLNYWFCATADEIGFTTTDQKNATVLYEHNSAGGSTVTKGEWVDAEVNLVKCAYDGKLRMGLATDLERQVKFYIDEIKVEKLNVDLSWDPTDTVMDYENILPDTFMDNYVNGSGVVSSAYNHTKGGKHSLAVTKLTNAGIDRTQMVLLNPANGQPYEFEVGQTYKISMWVYAPYETGDIFAFNMWMMSTNTIEKINNKNGAESDMRGSGMDFLTGEWSHITETITIKHGKYLILGLTNHSAAAGYGSKFYLDDIEVAEPEYITIKFDTNGSKDKIKPIRGIIGVPMTPYEEDDPYREGYKFTGWFTDKSCESKYFIDLIHDPLKGKDGDVLTVYAGWEKWDVVEYEGPDKEIEDKYELQYTEEKVWVDREPEILDLGDAPEAEVETIVDTPVDDPTPAPVTQEGLPTWLIIVIIIGGVLVVGGGAAIALLLSKKKPEIDA